MARNRASDVSVADCNLKNVEMRFFSVVKIPLKHSSLHTITWVFYIQHRNNYSKIHGNEHWLFSPLLLLLLNFSAFLAAA